MLVKILQFVKHLRIAGINVGLDQVITCLHALTLIDFNPNTFLATLRAIFAKSANEIYVFEKVYKLDFGEYHQNWPLALFPHDPSDRNLNGKASGFDGKGLGHSGVGPSKADLINAFRNYGNIDIKEIAQQYVQRLNFTEDIPQSLGEYWKMVQHSVDWHMINYQIDFQLNLNELDSIIVKQKLELFKDYAEEFISKKLMVHYGEKGLEQVITELNYASKSFNDLEECYLKIVRLEIMKIGRKLATRKGYRLNKNTYGMIDLRRTVRQAVAVGGIPFKLKRKARLIAEPDLIVICDISNSVARFSKFMLLLIYSMQSRLKNIRSFVFVDRIFEVTELLHQKDITEAIDNIGMHAPCSASGYSDYGRVFHDFYNGHSHNITPKTKLVILGDAKNNWRPAGEDFIKLLSQKTAGIYWLNPLPRHKWFQADSVLDLYQPYCKFIDECGNLQNLKRVSSRIF